MTYFREELKSLTSLRMKEFDCQHFQGHSVFQDQVLSNQLGIHELPMTRFDLGIEVSFQERFLL